jgi:hypothetical protein
MGGDMLGGMGRELDSEMLRRLQDNYREMSDGELQRLAAKPDELTDAAREALRGEMAGRNLKVEDAAPASFAGMERDPLPKPEVGAELAKGMVVLTTFYDAIAVGEACDWLEADGMDVDVRDVSQKGGLGTVYGGPPVSLQVIVAGRDRDRAMRILREKMGLFPLQEVEVADAVVDDGTVSAVGYFGRREDADEVARVLDDARIWHKVTANAEGSVEEENAFSVEVREVDLVKAGDVVEKAMGF